MSENAKTSNSITKVKIKNVVLSYVNILKAREDLDGKLKYSCVIMIDKKDKTTINAIGAGLKEAYEVGVKSKWGGVRPAKGTFKTPLRDGDIEKPEDPLYAGHFFMNAKATNRPGVLNLDGIDLTEPGREEEVYSGMTAHVSVNFFAYGDARIGKGIGCGLNNVMKVADGEFLGGRQSASSDFAEELQAAPKTTGSLGNENFDDFPV